MLSVNCNLFYLSVYVCITVRGWTCLYSSYVRPRALYVELGNYENKFPSSPLEIPIILNATIRNTFIFLYKVFRLPVLQHPAYHGVACGQAMQFVGPRAETKRYPLTARQSRTVCVAVLVWVRARACSR